MKLYIYDHCPFCVKARMIFGLKNIPVELNVLQNDDEATPTRMIGQKMVPILQKDDSRYLPESMDIVHYVDNLDGKPLLTGKRNPAIEEWLRKVNGYVNQLLLPRFAKSAFDEFLPLRRVSILSAKKKPHLAVLTTILRTLQD